MNSPRTRLDALSELVVWCDNYDAETVRFLLDEINRLRRTLEFIANESADMDSSQTARFVLDGT